MRTFAAAFSFALVLSCVCCAEEVTLLAVRADTPPVIDAVLNDEVWSKAEPITDFYVDRYGKDISQKTVARLAYDDKFVYAAFYCYDDPAQIWASERKRAGAFSSDDYVGMRIDPFHSKGAAHEFMVNPLGTQDDEILGGSAANIRWRGDWQAAAKIVEDGWTVEIAIPLQILRYPEGQDKFHVVLYRVIQRNRESGYWPPGSGIYFDATAAATWAELKLPPLSRPWVVMPYGAVDWRDGDTDVYFGLDLKKAFTNGLSLVLTLNPDFRNIEGDVLGLDFSYVEKAVAETRPFFTEGSDYFPAKTLFYTQRIEDVDFGAKLFGRVERTEFGFLDVTGADERNDAALSIRHDLTDVWSLSADAASRTDPDVTNAAAYFQAEAHQPHGTHELIAGGSYALTSTSGDGGDGYWATAKVDWARSRAATGFGTGLYLEEMSPDFNPLDGYAPERDFKGAQLYASYTGAYDKGKVENYNLYFRVKQYNRTDGEFFHRDVEGSASVDFRDWLAFGAGYVDSDRREGDVTHEDGVWTLSSTWNRRQYRREGKLTTKFGRTASQDYFFASLQQELGVTDKLAFGLRGQHRILGEDEQSQGILTFNYDITPERGISGRIVATEDAANGWVGFRQRTRKGFDIFAAIGDPNAEEFTKRVALKITLCFEM